MFKQGDFLNDQNATPEQIARKRELIRKMMPQFGKAQYVGEGIGQLFTGIGMGFQDRALDTQENTGIEDASNAGKALLQRLTGRGSAKAGDMSVLGPIPADEASAAPPAASGGMGSYRDAIAGIESKGSGDYSAVGPTNSKLGRALGRYQIMEANIGPWSKEALGREVTPDEFMANPQLQDQIFDHKFNGYVNQYGPEGAAQAWLGGPGGVGKTDRKDSLGTSIGEYGNRFMAGIGANPSDPMASQPGMAASASPAMGYAAPQPVEATDLPPIDQMAQQPAPSPLPANVPMPTEVAQNGPMQAPQMAPDQGGMSDGDLQDAIAVMNKPFLPPEMKAQLQFQVEQEIARRENQQALAQKQQEYTLKQQSPDYQLGLQKTQLEIDNLKRGKNQSLVNAGDGRLYDPNTKEWISAPTQAPGSGGFRFGGNSVEAQSLNGLLDAKKITEEQAQQLGAGKTITGPNGEIMFMTPQGVFGGQSPAQAPAQGGGIDIFGGGSPAPASPQASPQATPDPSNGLIPITAPKITESEKNAMTYADRMTQAGATIDSMGMAGSGRMDQLLGDWMPFGLDSYATSDDYKKVEQAKRDFINAQLRRESGAAIGASEFESADKQYFPQPGDTPEVIELKRKNRETVIKGMTRDAGPTYKAPKQEPSPDASIEDLLKKYGGN